MPSASNSSSFKLFALEILSIFIAVFLAFGVTEWGKSRSNQKLADVLKTAIIEELKRNKGLVEFMLPEHEELLLRVSQIPEDQLINPDSMFFLPVILRNTAWRMASETGALIHMEYKTATAIAEIYTFQEAYAELMQNMMASSFNISNYESSTAAQRKVIQYIAYVFVENEKALVEAYSKALGELEE